VGLDPHEGFAKMNKDGDVKNAIGIQVQVLDTVVLEKTLEEVGRRECRSALRESGKHGDLIGIFLNGVWVARGGAPHIHLLLVKEPAVHQGSRSSVFIFDFFHSLFGLGRAGDVGGDDPWADPSASLRDLFFPAPAPAFAPLDEEDYILQVHGVFTRIRSGVSLAASSGGVCGSADYGVAAVARVAGILARSTPTVATVGNEKTLRVSASIYNLTGDAATAGWISIGG
jgi:hypothetical protein